MWAVMGWSTEFFQENRHKALGFSSMDDFIINFMYAYFSPMDPNNLLCMAWKAQRADVSRHTGGDLRAALNRIKAKVFGCNPDGAQPTRQDHTHKYARTTRNAQPDHAVRVWT